MDTKKLPTEIKIECTRNPTRVKIDGKEIKPAKSQAVCNTRPVIIAQRGRSTGGGKTKQQLEINTTNTTNTLTAVQKDNLLLYEGRIRRLTEVECERFQGFPDNWTKYGNYDGVVKEISATQRYKLCGNAVTVDIVQMIGEKLNDGQDIVLVSLFSGIDGFAKGLLQAGIKIKHHYFSEIDKHAIANCKYNFPNAEHIGSVKNVSGADIRRKYPTAKIIVTFGWPCQDNSLSGKRLGQRSGTRSGLLTEAGRIIHELRPQHFIAENVKGLYSVNEGIDFYDTVRFLTYLNSDSPQYTVEMQLLNTAWILPQNRERTYFVGHFGTECIKTVFPVTENASGAIKGARNAATIRTLIGGGAFRRDAQHDDLIACVNDRGKLRDMDIVNCIDRNYHKGVDNHGQRTMIKIQKKNK